MELSLSLMMMEVALLPLVYAESQTLLLKRGQKPKSKLKNDQPKEEKQVKKPEKEGAGGDPKTLYPSIGEVKKAPTSHYWDCCTPSYTWNKGTKGEVRVCDKNGETAQPNSMGNVCQGGSGATCNDNQPWAVNDKLAFGFAAQNAAKPCQCFRLDLEGGKSFVVQVTNTGDMAHPEQFDLMIPGGGTGAFPEGCSTQWGAGAWIDNPYGGVIKSRDDCDSKGLPEALRPGCYWRFDWFGGVENPTVDYSLIECPQEIIKKSQCSPQ